MTIHRLPQKRPHIALTHLQRTQALHGKASGVIAETDPSDDPAWLAAQLPGMAASITSAFHKIAAAPSIETCELAAAQLHGVVVHLIWISQGLAKQGQR